MTQLTWDQAVTRTTWKLGQEGQDVVGTTTTGLLETPLHPGLTWPCWDSLFHPLHNHNTR